MQQELLRLVKQLCLAGQILWLAVLQWAWYGPLLRLSPVFLRLAGCKSKCQNHQQKIYILPQSHEFHRLKGKTLLPLAAYQSAVGQLGLFNSNLLTLLQHITVTKFFMNNNLKFLSMAAFAAMTVFSSCGGDDEAKPAEVMPTSYSARLLGAQTNAAGSFFSGKTGTVYGTGDSANFTTNAVDFSFAQTGSPAVAKFVSLSSRRAEGLGKVTTNARTSNFKATAYTKAAFDTLNNAEVKAIVAGTSAVIAITPSTVYAFKNVEGKTGLIYISNLDNGTGTNGSVTIDVKFEK